MNFCKESSTEKDVIIKTLPITMTLNRLKDLGKRLFGLGNKQLEFSYLTKEVNLNSSKIKTMYLLSTSVFYTLFFLYFHPLLSVMYCAGHPCPLSPKSFVFPYFILTQTIFISSSIRYPVFLLTLICMITLTASKLPLLITQLNHLNLFSLIRL